MRSFDPRSVGALECRAWETYYRRKWGAFLVASVGLVRAAFRKSERLRLDPVRAAELEAAPETVRPAAAPRAEAMDVSDRWVAAGCDPEHPLLARERALLVRSYAFLLAAVHR